MALSSARTLNRLEKPGERRAFTTAFGANLVLNAGWNWLFFKARRPRWALAEILLLEASTLDLTRRTSKADTPAARMLVPYAGWVAFATALNASIARHNPPQPAAPAATREDGGLS